MTCDLASSVLPKLFFWTKFSIFGLEKLRRCSFQRVKCKCWKKLKFASDRSWKEVGQWPARNVKWVFSVETLFLFLPFFYFSRIKTFINQLSSTKTTFSRFTHCNDAAGEEPLEKSNICQTEQHVHCCSKMFNLASASIKMNTILCRCCFHLISHRLKLLKSNFTMEVVKHFSTCKYLSWHIHRTHQLPTTDWYCNTVEDRAIMTGKIWSEWIPDAQFFHLMKSRLPSLS